MPARSISTATISFGLVSVPVNLYSSSESKTSVSFNMLHKKCGTRLKQQYTCPKDTGRAALGQYAARGQQHLVLLRPLNGVLVMEQLHYADEIRPPTEVPIPDGEVKAAELTLAKQLIEQASSDSFAPEKYKDNV